MDFLKFFGTVIIGCGLWYAISQFGDEGIASTTIGALVGMAFIGAGFYLKWFDVKKM